MIDLDAFLERAAIIEFEAGVSRFRAETLAAQAQGKQRREVLDEISRRNSEGQRDQRSTGKRVGDDNVPGVQRVSEKEERPMPERDVQG